MPTMSTKEAFAQARAFSEQGQYRAALAITRQLHRSQPHFPPIVALHVSVLVRLHRTAEAIRIARSALRHITHKQHRVIVINTLVDAMTQAGDLDDAITMVRDEIERQGDVAVLYSGLGHLYLLEDRKDEAVAIVEEARERGMMNAALASIYGRALLRSDRTQDAIELIEGLRDETDDEQMERESGNWFKALNALGHLYDRVKRYDDAIEAFTKSNSMIPVTYNEEQTSAITRDLIHLWTPESISDSARVPVPEGAPTPVFVMGMPRSGTTLTEQIIDAHPEGFGAGELGLITELYRQCAPDPNMPFSADPKGYDPSALREAARVYREETFALAGKDPNVRVITDKAPMNFWYMGFISMILPDARIVLCTREPRDNCLSCFFQALNPGHMYSFDLESCGLYYRHHVEICEHFKGVLRDDRVGVPVFDNVYEETIADQEAKTRALLDFVGLGFDEACLRFHESGRVALTLSNDQVRQPIYKSSTKRYERYAGHIGALERALGDLIPESERVSAG